MASAVEMTVWAHDPESRAAIPHSRSVRVLRNPTLQSARDSNVFVLTSATGLPKVTRFVRFANQQHRLRALLIREDIDSKLLPQMLNRANLRVLRNTLVHSELELPRRILMAWQVGYQDQLIATARVVGDRLFVISCALEVFEMLFESIPALEQIPIEERCIFEISMEGSYVHWPGPDIHLDLDAIRYAIDPELRDHRDAMRIAADKRFGAAIASVRKQHGLRQSDIAGLSERQVRRIENGDRTKAASLKYLAESHGMKFNEYLNIVAKAMKASTG